MKYKCLRCDYMSYDVMNTYAHVGYVHLGTYCTLCDTICFNSCPGTKTTGTTHSSVSTPSASSSFHSFLGNFHPRTAIEQDLDYVIRVSEKGVEGMWVCIVCGSTYQDFGVAQSHIKHDHSEIKCRHCNLFCNNFFTLDTHMKEAHSGQLPIQCQICTVWLPNNTVLTQHIKLHEDPNRSLTTRRYADRHPNHHPSLPNN